MSTEVKKPQESLLLSNNNPFQPTFNKCQGNREYHKNTLLMSFKLQ